MKTENKISDKEMPPTAWLPNSRIFSGNFTDDSIYIYILGIGYVKLWLPSFFRQNPKKSKKGGCLTIRGPRRPPLPACQLQKGHLPTFEKRQGGGRDGVQEIMRLCSSYGLPKFQIKREDGSSKRHFHSSRSIYLSSTTCSCFWKEHTRRQKMKYESNGTKRGFKTRKYNI